MAKNILTDLYLWARGVQQKQRQDKLIAMLEQRVKQYESDLAAMSHWPQEAQQGVRNLLFATQRRIELLRNVET